MKAACANEEGLGQLLCSVHLRRMRSRESRRDAVHLAHLLRLSGHGAEPASSFRKSRRLIPSLRRCERAVCGGNRPECKNASMGLARVRKQKLTGC
jgi:hypothetical protein